MEDFFGRYSFLYVHVPDYMEIFLDQEAHQGIDDNPRGDTSLYVMEAEVNFLGSIEERNSCKESGFEFWNSTQKSWCRSYKGSRGHLPKYSGMLPLHDDGRVAVGTFLSRQKND